mmetsp:Transcript_53686/g.121088  ORF Transcript_53686/g.121088 Transcript_53686/m.121088 type:complete len:205 (-) Transcript_53686:99-713(-)
MHLSVPPVATVAAPILPFVHAVAMEDVVLKLAFVEDSVPAISEDNLSRSALHAVDVLTFVPGAILADHCGLAMPLTLVPLPLVDRAVLAPANAQAVGEVVNPRAHIDVAIGKLEGAYAMSPAAGELPRVLAAIGPDLDTIAVGRSVDPLATVSRAIGEVHLLQVFSLVQFGVDVLHVPTLDPVGLEAFAAGPAREAIREKKHHR